MCGKRQASSPDILLVTEMATDAHHPRGWTRQDAAALYEAAFEMHGAMSLEHVHFIARDWLPRTRVPLALRELEHSGFAEVRHPPGQPEMWLLCLTNPAIALGWTRSPA